MKPTPEQLENRIALAITYRLAIEDGLVIAGPLFGYDEHERHDGRACVMGHTADHSNALPFVTTLSYFIGHDHYKTEEIIEANDAGRFADALAMLEELAGMR